jgi:hypothetical protein
MQEDWIDVLDFGSVRTREVLGRRDEGKPMKSMFGLS